MYAAKNKGDNQREGDSHREDDHELPDVDLPVHAARSWLMMTLKLSIAATRSPGSVRSFAMRSARDRETDPAPFWDPEMWN